MSYIKVKYLDENMPRITRIKGGDWLDLCCIEDVDMEQGEFKLIRLGVIIELPTFIVPSMYDPMGDSVNSEALLLPRSSTFKKYGIIMANSMGVIDNSYCGPEDEWMFAAYATRKTHIDKYTRIAQFRILQNQPYFDIFEVQEISNNSRGGFGSTGD